MYNLYVQSNFSLFNFMFVNKNTIALINNASIAVVASLYADSMVSNLRRGTRRRKQARNSMAVTPETCKLRTFNINFKNPSRYRTVCLHPWNHPAKEDGGIAILMEPLLCGFKLSFLICDSIFLKSIVQLGPLTRFRVSAKYLWSMLLP